jgi:hypothetical protein
MLPIIHSSNTERSNVKYPTTAGSNALRLGNVPCVSQ